MFSLILYIFMLVMGIVAITRSKIGLTASRYILGMPARIIGIILVLPLPLAVGATVVVTVFDINIPQASQVGFFNTLYFVWEVSGFIFVLLSTVIAIIIGCCTYHTDHRPEKVLKHFHAEAEEQWDDDYRPIVATPVDKDDRHP